MSELRGQWYDFRGTKLAVTYHPAFLLPEIRAEAARLKEEDSVIVDRLARDFLGMASGAGDTEINGRKVHIVGSFALGPDFMRDGTVMMSGATFARHVLGPPQSAAALPVVWRIASAQTHPARPAHLIVAAPPGGAADIVARLMSQWLSERLGQPFCD